MRLLLVSNDFPPRPGGIQQYLRGLVAAYPHDIRVLAPGDPAAPADPRVVRHHSSFMWPTRLIRTWVEREVADFRPDAILFGAPWPLPLLGDALRRRTGVPFAVVVHGAEVTLPAAVPGLRSLVVGPLRRADAVVAVSPYTQRRVAAIARRPVDLIGTGVDTLAFHPGPETGGAVPVIGCVSRFVPRKGQDLVIRAARILGDRGRDVRVLFVGRGRTEQRLRRLAEELAIDARFEVDVPWSRLGELYREMDVFAMPCKSRWFGLEVEGFGLVYLEAAASGLPVLVGDSGGAPDTIVPGRTGFVVHGLDDLVEGLELILSAPDRARQMGLAGRSRVVAEFTWERTVARLIAVLHRVV